MKNKFLIFPLLLTAVGLTSCAGPSSFSSGISTRYVLPNSNVQPLGPVTAKIPGETKLLGFPDLFTSENDRKIYNAAVQKVPGATHVIDFTKNYRTQFIPIPLGGEPLISWSTLEIEGTAVKASTGMQELH